MNEEDYPEIPCLPPDNGEVGDEWICDGCARKFHFVLFTLEPEGEEVEAWFTTEIR